MVPGIKGARPVSSPTARNGEVSLSLRRVLFTSTIILLALRYQIGSGAAASFHTYVTQSPILYHSLTSIGSGVKQRFWYNDTEPVYSWLMHHHKTRARNTDENDHVMAGWSDVMSDRRSVIHKRMIGAPVLVQPVEYTTRAPLEP